VTPRRWFLTFASFAAAIAVSVHVMRSTWPGHGSPATLPLRAHLLALAAVGLDIVFRAWKLQLSAGALRLSLPFTAAMRTSLGGDFGAAVTPARAGAEPARFHVLMQTGIGSAGVVLVMFAELFLEMLSLVVIVALCAVLFHGSGTMLAGVVGMVGAYAALVIGVGAAGVLLSTRNANGPPPAWAAQLGLHAGRWRAVQRSLRNLRTGIASLRRARAELLAAALGTSVIHVALRLAVLPALVYASGVHVHAPLAPLVIWPLALFYGGVVAPVPGGGGFIEIVFATTLSKTIPAAIFAASLLWWRVYTFYLYVALGALAAGRTAMRALSSGGVVQPMVEEAAVAEAAS
jgi:uncharacterized membrane protein YbhN (UPF0104 family)